MTIAAVLGLVLAQALHLPLPLWTVLTALIVTQMSVGRSLKTSTDYLFGTIGGTAYGGALALLIPHASEGALLGVLVLAVGGISGGGGMRIADGRFAKRCGRKAVRAAAGRSGHRVYLP